MQKLKVCYSCNNLRVIYKRIDGKPYCKYCAYKKVGKSLKIRPIAKKRASELAEYRIIREKFLKDHPYCEVKKQGCTGNATDIHHMGGKWNKDLLDSRKFLAVCRNCHDIITEFSKEAIEEGLSISRLKSEK